jgi:hypothetical protein
MKRVLAAFMLLSLCLPAGIFAQTSNATVGGTVSDATGALIPGVTVTATNTATGIVTTVVSNEAGAYQFQSLQVGTYRVTAELPGFQVQVYNNVTLGISQQVRLNFALQVGSVAQSVEVTVAADSLIATTSSSIGSVLPEQKVRDLPLGGRNVMDLLRTSGGVSNSVSGTTANDGATAGDSGYFAGGRLSAVNTTRDGFNVTDSRYNHGAFSVTYTSPDLVEEVRVITAPVDAEVGRGSGQVQMVTRSGTNQFRGSVFWNNRNSALDASNWFNNLNGVEKDFENRNQFGVRFAGPIIRNKTFFFVLIDEQRDVIKQTFVGNVLTEQARQGIFRFFPGVDNQNAQQNSPTVDLNGNPVRPANATGNLQSFSVFGRDAFRPGYDPTGFIQRVFLAKMPLPNDYTVGDGLNTAGIRWTRRISGFDNADGSTADQTNRDQFNIRLDHNFTQNHKYSLVYTWERGLNHTLQAGIPFWPGGYEGANNKWPQLLTNSLVSTLSPTVVNELRIGYKVTDQVSWPAWWKGKDYVKDENIEPGPDGKEAYDLLPKFNGVPYTVVSTNFAQNVMLWSPNAGSNRFSSSPQYSIGDTLGWSMAAHSFKVGGEWRYGGTLGVNEVMMPRAILGAGGVPVQNIDNVAVPGLSANNQTLARNILTDLSGSVASIGQAFDVRDSTDRTFKGINDGLLLKNRNFRGTELSWFFKDTWNVRPDLTLNLGIHWEYFGVPFELKGKLGSIVGGEKGLCGISCGALTEVEFVGKHSQQPDKKLYNDDWNNFAPSVGFAWSVPWFGQDKTVIRAGYGWSYTGRPISGANSGNSITGVAGGLPGTFGGVGNGQLTYTQANYMSLTNLVLPIPQQFPVLGVVPLNGSRSDTAAIYDPNRRSPYIQNFNFGIQRELASDLTLNVGYIGTKGTRLWGGIQLNTVDIFRNQFLDAFNVTRAGGSAPLFDEMLRGLNIPGAGVVNGTTVRGSAALRAYQATRGFVANGNVGGLADFLNRSRNITNQGGGFVRNSGLYPENFFVLNPQFQNANLYGSGGSSTYHSLEVQVTKRLSQGFTTQGTYTWSRALGDNDGDYFVDYRDPNNRKLNKAVLGFHRTHAFLANGTWELPLGMNHRFLSGAPAIVQRLVEQWQLGGILSWISGPPLDITAPVSVITQTTSTTTPNIVGDFPKSSGQVTKVANGVTYFPGTRQITDPSIASVSTLNALSGAFNNKAIADASGNPLLVNPAPGQLSNMGLKWIEGPPALGLDMNLIKRTRITETKEFEIRVDAVNILNHPNFGVPNTNINNVAFGRITSAQGNRRFTLGARLNF